MIDYRRRPAFPQKPIRLLAGQSINLTTGKITNKPTIDYRKQVRP